MYSIYCCFINTNKRYGLKHVLMKIPCVKIVAH